MVVEKSKEPAPKKPESKAVEAKAEVAPKTVEAKTEAPATETKTDATPKKQGMGEGQKAVTKAYKDNWNDIFGKKKKR
jgi:hypothetical protein